MNTIDDLLEAGAPQNSTTPIINDEQAKAKADLSDEVTKLDEPHNEQVKEEEKFDKSKDWSYYKEQGYDDS
jgi:hypothetical protein